jgi:mevalonate kinase
MTTASAPGKIILFGEHAVVYGQPALAVPVRQVQAVAEVVDAAPGSGIVIHALDIGKTVKVSGASSDPLALTARLVSERFDSPGVDVLITVRSTIPIAGGLGSGAAVSAALGRALSSHLGRPLPPDALSEIVFESEKRHHGTPSGIDNTVICYEMPVYYVKGQPPAAFRAGASFHLLIADSGIASPTSETVGDVRRAWERDPQRYERIFQRVGAIVEEAHDAIRHGDVAALGPLMAANQALLRELDVSSPPLERLIDAALAAGAGGAKLSGGGRGGNMIALADTEDVDPITDTLYDAGARRVIHTVVGAG